MNGLRTGRIVIENDDFGHGEGRGEFSVAGLKPARTHHSRYGNIPQRTEAKIPTVGQGNYRPISLSLNGIVFILFDN
jgi:hypothetical protein